MISLELAFHRDLKVVRDSHAKSDWSACKADANSREAHFGSLLLIEACFQEELSLDKMLKRISPRLWFAAARRIGEAMAKPLANHFFRRLQSALGAIKKITLPPVDYTISTAESTSYPFLDVDEADCTEDRFPKQKTLKEIFNADDDFDARQERLYEISDTFLEELENSGAQLSIESVTIDDIKLLADPKLLHQILEMLEQHGSTGYPWLRNIALAVANLTSKDMPDRAIGIFQKAVEARSFVTYNLGDGLTLEHKAIWSSAPSQAIDAFWRQRLLKSNNDECLALEVLAAERFGAADFINTFSEKLAGSASTLDQAYAITIAGLSKQSGKLDAVIDEHLDSAGIIGDAARNAKAARKSFQRATKWISDMCAAQSPEEFWCYLMIAKTCMDARVSTRKIFDTKWVHFAPLVWEIKKFAIEELSKTRKKTLLGQEVPDEIFINGD